VLARRPIELVTRSGGGSEKCSWSKASSTTSEKSFLFVAVRIERRKPK
jgi:hypothetical protein